MEKSTDIPNIAMADAFMKIFGYRRIKPTDDELKSKYKNRKKECREIEKFLEDIK